MKFIEVGFYETGMLNSVLEIHDPIIECSQGHRFEIGRIEFEFKKHAEITCPECGEKGKVKLAIE